MKLFESLLKRYQKNLEESMRGSEFAFDGFNALYYDFNKWLTSKKATINPNNDDDKCFQYALTAALNHEQIGKNPQRISKIRSFIDQYNWKEIVKTGKSLNETINQLVSIFCMCLVILKK